MSTDSLDEILFGISSGENDSLDNILFGQSSDDIDSLGELFEKNLSDSKQEVLRESEGETEKEEFDLFSLLENGANNILGFVDSGVNVAVNAIKGAASVSDDVKTIKSLFDSFGKSEEEEARSKTVSNLEEEIRVTKIALANVINQNREASEEIRKQNQEGIDLLRQQLEKKEAAIALSQGNKNVLLIGGAVAVVGTLAVFAFSRRQ